MSRAWLLARTRAAVPHGRLDHPLVKFVLLPLLLAIPAFRLHQHIAFGSSFGEFYSFGLAAYLAGEKSAREVALGVGAVEFLVSLPLFWTFVPGARCAVDGFPIDGPAFPVLQRKRA